MTSNLQSSLLYLIYLIIMLTPIIEAGPPPVTLTIQQAQKKYNKKYKNEEQKTYRRAILQQNKKKINDHNKLSSSKYFQGQNLFIDLSSEQFVRTYMGLIPSTPAARQFVRDTAQLKVREDEICDCGYKIDTKKLDLKKKISKNNQEYTSTIEKYINKIKAIDTSLPYSITPKNRSPTPTPTTISSAANLLSQTLITNQTSTTPPPTTTTITTTVTLPTTDTNIDWTNQTGPIRYQGLCGACYAFTAVQVLQTANSIYLFGGVYIQLSVQQVLDCAVMGSGWNGCDGGLLEWSYAMMMSTGITANFRYPYTSGTTGTAGTCQKTTGSFKIISFRQLNGTCADLRTQLKSKPVSTPIKAKNMQFYSSGIFIGCRDTDPFDHAVVIVGYNSTLGWKFKNSWGSGWGMDGYGWLSLDDDKNCGICVMPVVPKTYNQP